MVPLPIPHARRSSSSRRAKHTCLTHLLAWDHYARWCRSSESSRASVSAQITLLVSDQGADTRIVGLAFLGIQLCGALPLASVALTASLGKRDSSLNDVLQKRGGGSPRPIGPVPKHNFDLNLPPSPEPEEVKPIVHGPAGSAATSPVQAGPSGSDTPTHSKPTSSGTPGSSTQASGVAVSPGSIGPVHPRPSAMGPVPWNAGARPASASSSSHSERPVRPSWQSAFRPVRAASATLAEDPYRHWTAPDLGRTVRRPMRGNTGDAQDNNQPARLTRPGPYPAWMYGKKPGPRRPGGKRR